MKEYKLISDYITRFETSLNDSIKSGWELWTFSVDNGICVALLVRDYIA